MTVMDHDGGFEVSWQYEWSPRTWVDFLPEQCAQAECAFVDDLTTVVLVGEDGSTPIELDFVSMTQSGKVQLVRKIRRVAVLVRNDGRSRHMPFRSEGQGKRCRGDLQPPTQKLPLQRFRKKMAQDAWRLRLRGGRDSR